MEDELTLSLTERAKVLSPDRIIALSFWIGEQDQEIEGLLFFYYSKERLMDIISENFKVMSTMSYQGFEESDSLLVIAKLNVPA
jgi:hypothetical protein